MNNTHYAVIPNNSFVAQTVDQTNYNIITFLDLLKLPEVQAVMQTIIDAAIATSELKILQRLSKLEQIVISDPDLIDDDATPSIQAQVENITQRISSIENWIKSPACKTKEDAKPQPIIPTTKTEVRASELVSHALDSPNNFLTRKEMDKILKESIEAEKRPKALINPRMALKCALSKVVDMFPFTRIDRSKYGNHELRLVIEDKKSLMDHTIKHGMLNRT
jgi:uncharacterized ubiquitin-like protein YukD